MTSILENELVKKYFKCGDEGDTFCVNCDKAGRRCPDMALRVLRAMEEPIKEGDRYLYSDNSKKGEIFEEKATSDIFPWWNTIGLCLRLPDQFQKQEEKKECDHPFKNLVFQYHRILCCLCAETVEDSYRSLAKRQAQDQMDLNAGTIQEPKRQAKDA